MAAEDYYSILGVGRDASQDEISRAYKKKALSLHPDRHVNDPEDVKKDCEEKFKKVSEAYSVLGDPEKKRQYDTFGAVGGDGQGFGQGFDPFEIFRRHFGGGSGFGEMFNGFARREYDPPRGQDVLMRTMYDVKDYYSGGVKTLKYKKKYRCPVCHGEGGTGMETCPACGGTGMETVTQRTPFGIMQQSRPCSRCGGAGKTVKSVCPHCGGTGFDAREESIDIQLPAGCQDGARLAIAGKGHESKDMRGTSGDFIVEIRHAPSRGGWKISGTDVILTTEVDWIDCMLGRDITVMLPDGREKRITLKECTPDGKIYRITGNGVKVGGHEIGDCLVEIAWKLPKSLDRKSRDTLKSLKAAGR